MAASREEILADFQACTGIDDVSECILHLEAADWSLLDAVHRVMPQETQTLPSEQPRVQVEELMDVDVVPSDDAAAVPAPVPFVQPVSSSDEVIPAPSTSQSRMRLIHFKVEFRDRTVPLIIPDCETVATIKTVLFSELSIPPCKQDLRGWKSKKITDDTVLSTLNLPKENNLYLLAPEVLPSADMAHNGDDPNVIERMNQIFKLNLTDDTNHKQYSVNYQGKKTIREVKQDVYTFTDIPVRHQVWTGWPRGAVSDSMTLAGSGVSYPCHNLTVRRATSTSSVENARNQIVVDIASDSSSEEFEDASESFNIEDEMFVHDVSSRKVRPLIPDNMSDETDALNHFAAEFTNRYGDCHPMFFQGSLDDALKEACLRPAKERKLLAIYLHHDGSVLTNVFCTQLLCSETIVSYLTNNFITWAWDLTHEARRLNLLSMVTKHFGSVAAQTIRNFNEEQLPLLLIIMRSRSSTEVFTIIHGSVSVDELMTSLIHAVDCFSSQQQIEIKEEEEREARETVKREQDLAYEESLQADRIKEESKRMEEEERMKKEREVSLQKEKEEQALKQQAALKEAIRQSLEGNLPAEPAESSPEPTSQIRFRLPNGEMLLRRFRINESLQTMLDFLVVKGYDTGDFKVLTSWPRRDLTTLNPTMTLDALKLYPQETVMLEER